MADVARSVGLELTPPGVLRHDGGHCADLGDPRPVEPGDIPTQVEPPDVDEPPASVLAACRWSVSVVVQGSAPADRRAGGAVRPGAGGGDPGAETENDEYLAPAGSWLGLPARPVAWGGFGPAYRRLVPTGLPTEPAGDGVLHAWSDALLDRDELPASWLPADLTCGGRDAPAARLPRGLRTTTWDALRGRG